VRTCIPAAGCKSTASPTKQVHSQQDRDSTGLRANAELNLRFCLGQAAGQLQSQSLGWDELRIQDACTPVPN
jgi:hypothetical protein